MPLFWIPAFAGMTTMEHFPRSPSQLQSPSAFLRESQRPLRLRGETLPA